MLMNSAIRITILVDTQGQDFIEHILAGGFVAAVVGAITPGVADTINAIMSRLHW